MSLVKTLIHLFVPHESNNQKAKILHPSSLSILALFLIFAQIAITGLSRVYPTVLGCASSISASDIVRLTNEKRIQSGLSTLSENSILSQAALAKGTDMLNKGYWAHFAPDGTTPWSFFTQFGYKYKYAGENLARDFCSASATVDAWMNSPTHRENVLSSNYKEIGIGVLEGNLAGADTTLVVQFFGNSGGSTATIPIAKAQGADTVATTKPAATVRPTPATIATPTPSPLALVEISPFKTTKDLSMAIVGVLILVLSIDLIVVRRKRIMRIGGRTLAHIAYFGMILAIVLILEAGQII